MANEKMDLIKHMALLRNVANDVTEIMSSTAAADFINAAIEIINDYPSDGKLVDTGTKSLHIPRVSVSSPDEREVVLEALSRYSKPDATFGNPSSLSDTYKKEGWLECYAWLKGNER